ncbi:hypothetical protein L6452_03631 [Arctium lappa]|uniref:Uncharacterized protein n=1 Tax=Arctium lappa TaxID=4217 RepID=A0ACB9FNN4_ARCLA|nr:hypothetical protein L6452_03631 [Arctium lappa]
MDSHKNPNLETTHKHEPSSHKDLKISFMIKNLEGSNSSSAVDDDIEASRRKRVVVVEEMSISGRERLKRHRVEMAGRVWIPDIWGQEDLLKNWIDCTVFDSSLNKSSIMSAREALIQQAPTSTLSC